MIARAAAVLVLGAAACSAPALNTDLAAAEAHEKAGEDEAALSAYVIAQESCKSIRDKRLKRETCAQAHIGHAELLEDLDRKFAAAAAYEAVPEALGGDEVPSAKATYRAGRLYLSLGNEVKGYKLLWKTVTNYSDIAYSVDALRVLFNDGRKRNNRQLYQVLVSLLEPLAGNEVADNILYYLADLAEHDFERPKVALGHYDVIIADYREGGLFDESCWHAARLARASGDPKGAIARLKKLLATREVAMGIGSYFSVWLDDSQLEVGRILRDDLHDYAAAVAAFRKLASDYPASILKDDAIYETAVAWQKSGKRAKACESLTKLEADWPDSKYELEKAPALRTKLGCKKSQTAESNK